MNRTHFTAAVSAEATATRLARRALMSVNIKGAVLGYAKILMFCERIVSEGALFLIGESDGTMCFGKYEVLCSMGLADLAALMGRLATLVAAAIQNDRAQARVTGATFQADAFTHRIAQSLWVSVRKAVSPVSAAA